MQTLWFMLRFLGSCVFLTQLSWTSSDQTDFLSPISWVMQLTDKILKGHLGNVWWAIIKEPSFSLNTSETWEKTPCQVSGLQKTHSTPGRKQDEGHIHFLRQHLPTFCPPFCVFCFLKAYETQGRKLPRSTKICFRTGTGVQSGVGVSFLWRWRPIRLFGWWRLNAWFQWKLRFTHAFGRRNFLEYFMNVEIHETVSLSRTHVEQSPHQDLINLVMRHDLEMGIPRVSQKVVELPSAMCWRN